MIRKKESSSSTEIKSILAEGLKIEGNVLSEGKIRIDGEINGDIKGDYIILGETSKIKGNILSEFIVIMGTVEGNISSQEVEIKTTGKVRGDIVTQKLSIEPGASIEGTLRSGDFYEKNVSIFSIETVE
jgi:cytoskeletal protein CcmA (bactofilin family)